MAPPRKLTNGQSPLVNQQRQITNFFSPSPSPISSLPLKTQNPNPIPTPSSLSTKKKPNLLIPPSPNSDSTKTLNKKKPISTIPPLSDSSSPPPISDTTITPESSKNSVGEDVVGRRIRVYWPLDKIWYEGAVKYFDRVTGKHSVQYDDADVEELDLEKEKIEWVEERVRSFRRLRRNITPEKLVLDDEEDEGESTKVKSEGGDDDSEDEDWGKNVEKEIAVDDDLKEMDLEDEGIESLKRVKGEHLESRKRKKSDGEKLGSEKKIKSNGLWEKIASKMSPKENLARVVEPVTNVERGHSTHMIDNVLTGDIAERFGTREARKLHFLMAERRDATRRRAGDVNYDPRTLYLPPDFLKSLSGGQRQWWEFKSKHMDKVIFFKMGKFYELFEMDAHVGAKELDLQYMKGEQPHCGFPEKNFSINLEKLARKGYRVLVVEQTETPEQLGIRRKEKGSKDKVVRREICAVVTKGTLTEGEVLSTNPDASYLMAIAESFEDSENQKDVVVIGVCVVDVSTSRFMLGQFWDADKTIDEVRNISRRLKDSNNCEDLPEVISKLVNAGKNGSCALSAFGGCLFYLRQAFLDETLLRFAKYELLPCSGYSEILQKPYMLIDAAAIDNLEIFENNRNGVSTGTLYAHLNHCVTAFGKRLLKNWLARPLYHVESIRERQDAVAGLKGDSLPSVLEFRKDISRLPDMERLLARLFASSEANGRNANKVVLYEDAPKKQLQEFITVLRGCELISRACLSLSQILTNVESGLLCHLLTPDEGLPDIHSSINHFKDAFDWVEADQSGRIIPHEGVDNEYDSACKTVMDVESSFAGHLKEQHKVLGDSSITYVTVGKDLYLLEVPESLQGCVPRDYELRSSKKGFFRYWTPQIKELLGELSQAEAEKESKLKSILQRLIGLFCKHHYKWRELVSTVAELDVLISLAAASDYYEGPTCRPTITGSQCINEVPCLSAKNLGHPVLRSDFLGRGTFVSNNITIGGSGNASFILLTGPNMGGKSTLLRQVCMAVILAQLGADVPAEYFELSPVDRIFVRMGARDHIMAGQSTFLTELSETASMLSSATRNSLVALDELGRGTSTSDGQAIAESVLEHFVHNINCRGMFSTHYHRLAVDYEKDPQVSLCHMACHVGSEVGGVEEVTFLYRLTPGACPKSYGVNVARLAGLPDSVLQTAAIKSKEFEENYGKRRKRSEDVLSNHSMDEKVAIVIQDLDRAVSSFSCHETSESTDIGFLREIQQQARLLLAGS
ncbi:hypothetical protein GIB67_039721 [Kingdonia uniflora]|uniref:DNA mismatch repair protein n=1 Tax=Kingdonia uniflora TaxID=39325 RepID=A0A7J7MQ85_9MAGN|nr:hypothetical protein GIB67_039721 [Kingdonia uniflora]